MDHRVSGDNHIIITSTCTQLVTPEPESLAGVSEILSIAQAQAGLHSSHCLGAGWWWLGEAVAVAGSVLFSQ